MRDEGSGTRTLVRDQRAMRGDATYARAKLMATRFHRNPTEQNKLAAWYGWKAVVHALGAQSSDGRVRQAKGAMAGLEPD